MSLKINVNITAPDIDNPIKGNDWKGNLKRLANLHRSMAGGNKTGTFTVAARTSATAATGTATAAVVTNAQTVTINGQAFTATQQYARGTLTAAAVAPGDTCVVNGITFTARKENASSTVTCASVSAADTVTVNGIVFTANVGVGTAVQFDQSGTDTATAAALVVCINAHASLSPILSATNAAGVVTIRALAGGTAGNAYTLVSSNGSRLAVTGSGSLAGGVATSTITFDAAVAGFNTQVAASLVTAINANATTSLIVTAASALGVVTIRSLAVGTAGNSYTLVGTAVRLVASAATLGGGAAVGNNQFDFGGSNTQTAASLAAAINASTSAIISGHVTATSSAAVVTIAAKLAGVSGNAITLASSDGATLAVSSTRLTGGAETLVTMTF